MTTVNEFHNRITAIIEDLEGDARALFTDHDRQTGFLSRLAKVLEASHQTAIRTLSELISDDFPEITNELRENIGEIDEDADQFSEPEFGFYLYWAREEREQLFADLEDGGTALALNILDRALPASAITSNHTAQLFGTAQLAGQRPVWISGDGTAWGTGQYEQLDIGWANAVTNLVSTLWHHTIVKPFPTRPCFKTVPLQPNGNDEVKIAIVGDWGGGNDLAKEVMNTIKQVKPDYVIHLGDTYYAGTDQNGSPPNEEQDFLVNDWKKYGPAKEGRCFTLNSNHEMYSGARGLFNVALPDPMFSGQENYSYFALEFDDWVLVGFDSAYYASSLTMYLNGDMGGSEDPQYGFLADVAKLNKKVILMCHHNPMTYDGKKGGIFWQHTNFWNEIHKTIVPDYWYWGHIHMSAVYNDKSAAGSIKCRCVGHGCIPFGTPRGLVNDNKVDWFSHTPMNVPDEKIYPSSATRVKNGFAMITLGQGTIKEEYYNMGSTTPVYQI